MDDLAARLASLDDDTVFRLVNSLANAVTSLRRAGLSTEEIGAFMMQALATVGRR